MISFRGSILKSTCNFPGAPLCYFAQLVTVLVPNQRDSFYNGEIQTERPRLAFYVNDAGLFQATLRDQHIQYM